MDKKSLLKKILHAKTIIDELNENSYSIEYFAVIDKKISELRRKMSRDISTNMMSQDICFNIIMIQEYMLMKYGSHISDLIDFLQNYKK